MKVEDGDVSDQVCVAIVAEHASARFGGEAILPLHYFRFLRKRGIDAYLVVHERTREELSEVFPDEVSRIIYVKDSWLHRALWRAGKVLPHRIRTVSIGWLMHLLTQVHQRSIVRALVKDGRVNLVHEPIPVSPRMPSLMCKVDAPVIIGPMNGGMTYPPNFLHLQSSMERYLLTAGRSLSGILNWLIPGKRKAAMLLVANDRTRRALPPGVGSTVVELVENGVDLNLWESENQSPIAQRSSFRVAYMGRLVDWKAVDILLEAFAILVSETECVLDIFGDGHERQSLEKKSADLELQGKVRFWGFLSQSECRKRLAKANVLVLPSLYECGGAVVLEAMAMRIPVIATRWGGPMDYLNDSCGFLIEPDSASVLRDGIVDAMRTLQRNPELGRKMGNAGRELIEQHFAWDRKIDTIIDIYRTVVAHQ